MNPSRNMAQHVDAYLVLRRAFGFHLTIAGMLLRDFAGFADRVAPGKPLTATVALSWAQSSITGKQVSAARRLVILRPFTRYLRTIDPATEVLPQRILGPAQYRHIPHIYTEEEIRSLLHAAASLRPRGGLRALSVQAYIGLMACTGLRPQEPLRLTRAEVDLQSHSVIVRETKFSKSRRVMLHSTGVDALRRYAQIRDRRVPSSQSAAFFLCDDGTALTLKKARWAFNYLRRQLGWAGQAGIQPRLYDLRHTFVCRRLLTWYRDGVDVQVALPALSTYLGHVKVTDTYWYVTAIPELMNTVSTRFERFVRSAVEDQGDCD
jgi:integrase